MLKCIISLVEWCVKRWHYKSRFEDKLDTLIANDVEHNKRLLRLELDSAMRRNDRATVHALYDEYVAMGGNSYMQELYKEYCKKNKKRSKRC